MALSNVARIEDLRAENRQLTNDVEYRRKEAAEQREKADRIGKERHTLELEHKQLKSMYDSALALISRLQAQLKLEQSPRKTIQR